MQPTIAKGHTLVAESVKVHRCEHDHLGGDDKVLGKQGNDNDSQNLTEGWSDCKRRVAA